MRFCLLVTFLCLSMSCDVSEGSFSINSQAQLVNPDDPGTGSNTCVSGNNHCDEFCEGTDLDCIETPDPVESDPLPEATIESDCGGSVLVRAQDSPLGQAASLVAMRFPTAQDALDARNPRYFDPHTTGTGHAELEGFGVTLIQRDGGFIFPKPLEDASGDLDDPNLLFFEKTDGPKDEWPIIGVGYSFHFHDSCEPPSLEEIPSELFLIHEAGWHHSPGDGNFECATTNDLKQSSQDAGKEIDTEGCIVIEKSDIKERVFDAEHGRIWTVHVWFEPGTNRPTITAIDPWCRQSEEALPVECDNGLDEAFFFQGDCSEFCD